MNLTNDDGNNLTDASDNIAPAKRIIAVEIGLLRRYLCKTVPYSKESGPYKQSANSCSKPFLADQPAKFKIRNFSYAGREQP
jgi:hypothetical protein